MNVNVADAEISPIELEIIYNALTAAAAEMDVTIWRTSRSTIVRELLDYSTAIFDRDGWNVAQAARIPSHLNSMSYFLTEILARHIPPDRWGPDDIVISNDPYCGGQHLPDIVAYKAVFRNGRRIGFVGTLCHHLDVGGSSPGSYGSSATEIFQEGLRIPPVKMVEGGKLNEPIRAHHPAERPPAGDSVGRSAVAARLAAHRRGKHRAPRRKARRGAFRSGDPAVARSIRGRHARRDRPYSRRHLRVRGSCRRRRDHGCADPHPRQG